MAGNIQDRGQSVAGRLLRVLEVFTSERPHLTIVEISRRTAGPPGSRDRCRCGLLVSVMAKVWASLERFLLSRHCGTERPG